MEPQPLGCASRYGRNKVIFRRLKPAAACFFPKLASSLKISGFPRGKRGAKLAL